MNNEREAFEQTLNPCSRERIIPVPTALIKWAYEPESEDVSHFNDGYDAARRWVKMQIDYAVKKAQEASHD